MKARVPVVLALSLALLTGCAGNKYAQTAVPAGLASTIAPGAAAPRGSCQDVTRSYRRFAELPSAASLNDGAVRKIRARGYLIAGVSSDTYLFGATNPRTGQIVGFNVDMVRAVAKAILGDPEKVQFRALAPSARINALQYREVDMIAANMTITCSRWKQIAFSAEYYHAAQQLLVPKGSGITSINQLAGKRVCAPAATSTMQTLLRHPAAKPVAAATDTGCLVLFQQGKVDAITGDNAILAGMAAQDPTAEVTRGAPLADEPYGIAFNAGDIEFTRYVNTVLSTMMSSGQWTSMYNTWLAGSLGAAPKPPTARYGR